MLYTTDKFTYQVRVSLPPVLYIKNPQETALGQSLLEHAAACISRDGLEEFNFRKLAQAAGCTEATVYRYFENKHKLVLLLMNLFWGYVDFQIQQRIRFEPKAEAALNACLNELGNLQLHEIHNPHFAELLVHLAAREGVKMHLGKDIHAETQDGSLTHYLRLLQTVEDLLRLNHVSYPRALAGLLLDSALQQHFYRHNEPLLTDSACEEEGCVQFLQSLIHRERGQK
ncbi:MAG: TetR/AcrR family transcriptional regulator [Bacteroidetes bacterium]|nr:TetR/AcrR family transcriptional regulator [Bacteroidota bacterium]